MGAGISISLAGEALKATTDLIVRELFTKSVPADGVWPMLPDVLGLSNLLLYTIFLYY